MPRTAVGRRCAGMRSGLNLRLRLRLPFGNNPFAVTDVFAGDCFWEVAMKRSIQIAIVGEAQQGQFLPTPTPCEVTLDCASFTIGSGVENCLRIDNPTISRQHLSIDFEGGDWTIRDLGSDNGLIAFNEVDPFAHADWHSRGKRVSMLKLNGRQAILIGSVALLFTAAWPDLRSSTLGVDDDEYGGVFV